MTLPKYERYKDSGVPWLGEIPAHWQVQRLKHACTIFPSNVNKHARDDEPAVRLCNYTDVYYHERITLAMPFMEATASEDQIAKFSLRAGDTIVTKDSETADDIAIAAFVPEDLPGIVCGYHLSMVRPRPGTAGAFIKRFFDCAYAKARFAIAANGLTRVGLGQYAIDNVDLPFPPFDEQTAIALFLDRETAKIDALIAEQEELICLLKEKRQATISHAATRGINPNVPQKDSGVTWLGMIPEHWVVIPLMHLTPLSRPIMYGIVLPGPDVEAGIPIVKGGDVKGHRLKLDLLNRTTAEIEAPYARARLKPFDIVYSIRGSIGDAEIVPEELMDANITQDVGRISPAPGMQPRWLLHVMKSKPVFAQLEQRSLGAAIRGINIFELKRARIAVPPAEERDQISKFLDSETAKLDLLRIEVERNITLIKERRRALISAAVTGQIDVRSAVSLNISLESATAERIRPTLSN